jgi:hypothetical protein
MLGIDFEHKIEAKSECLHLVAPVDECVLEEHRPEGRLSGPHDFMVGYQNRQQLLVEHEILIHKASYILLELLVEVQKGPELGRQSQSRDYACPSYVGRRRAFLLHEGGLNGNGLEQWALFLLLLVLHSCVHLLSLLVSVHRANYAVGLAETNRLVVA